MQPVGVWVWKEDWESGGVEGLRGREMVGDTKL